MNQKKLQENNLPKYTLGEEIVNAITHGCGVLMGIIVLLLCILKTSNGSIISTVTTCVYGCSMILLYLISTLYHSLVPSMGKKVFQILDHCSIFLLIAGTYTPIMMISVYPHDPISAGFIMALQWGVSAILITLNAIDMKRFRAFTYTGYIVLGWALLFIAPAAIRFIHHTGLLYIFLGGVSYTIGAIIFAIGTKKRWFHSVFHVFVLLGSLLQFIGIYQYLL